MRLPVPGEHNVLNALAAIGAAAAAGCDPAQAAAALATFQPAGRRFEPRGERAGVRVFDDYAHHATEVEATLRGGARARAAAAGRRLPAAPVLAHRCTSTASSAAHWPPPTWSWCSTSTRARERAEDYPGVTGKLVADAAADHAGGRQVWWLPDAATRRRRARRPARRTATWS